MKKFKFKLQTPLKIKQMVEEINKQELLKAIIKKNEEQMRLNNLYMLTREEREQLGHHLCDSVRIRDINNYDAYLYYLQNATKQQKKNLSEAEKLCEHKRYSFLEAKKNRQILEKIRDKKLEIYNLEAMRQEQKITDEMASIRFKRVEEN